MSGKTKRTGRKTSKDKLPKKQEDLIDFDSWFWFKMRDKRLREVQKTEIKIFFSQKGLKDKEYKSKYEEILKLY